MTKLIKTELEIDAKFIEWFRGLSMKGAVIQDKCYQATENNRFIVSAQTVLSEHYQERITNNEFAVIELALKVSVEELKRIATKAAYYQAIATNTKAYKSNLVDLNLIIAESDLSTVSFQMVIENCKSSIQLHTAARELCLTLDAALRFSEYLYWRLSFLESGKWTKPDSKSLLVNPYEEVTKDEPTISEVIRDIEAGNMVELSVNRARNLLNMASRKLNGGDSTAEWKEIIRYCSDYI